MMLPDVLACESGNATDRTDSRRVSLPSDPAAKLTREQLLSIFGGANRLEAERDLLRLLREPKGERDAA